MNNRWVPLLIICLTVVLGHILSRIHIAKYKRRYIETGEFRDKFIDLVNQCQLVKNVRKRKCSRKRKSDLSNRGALGI